VATAVGVETTRAETAEALLAPKASPALTGTPTAPTAPALADSTQVATTAYADSAVAVETSRAEAAEALKVTGVTAADGSVAIGGTSTAPTVRTGTLDVIATQHPPAAPVPMAGQKLTGVANGSASTDGAAYGQTLAGGNSSPLTATGDLLYASAANTASRLAGNVTATRKFLRQTGTGSASAAPAWDTLQLADLPAGSAGQVLGVSAGAPAWMAGMTLRAATLAAGYTLVNGTGAVITWDVPDDGALHWMAVFASLSVTSDLAGGEIDYAYVLPDGTASNWILVAAGGSAGPYNAPFSNLAAVEAGSTVTVSQATAKTAGAAVLWAGIWGS
jgi:hypothetical protein